MLESAGSRRSALCSCPTDGRRLFTLEKERCDLHKRPLEAGVAMCCLGNCAEAAAYQKAAIALPCELHHIR